MKIEIKAVMTGEDLVKNFVSTLELSNIKVPIKAGDTTPAEVVGVKFLVTNKSGQEVEIAPTHIKLVYNG
jgi:hypothetical protein